MAKADARTVEWDKCSADPAYFIHHYGWIKEPQGDGYSELPFHLWPAQVDTLWTFTVERNCIVLKARQLGISWLSCGYGLWLCLFRPGRRVLLFSRGEREANDLLDRIVYMYGKLPDWMRGKVGLLKDPTTSEILWRNGSSAESLPATQNAGRSFTASLVIMDETAFMQWADALYTALKPTIDSGGQLLIVSTANGARGLFYTLWQKAEGLLNGFKAIFLPWWVRPGRDAAWYARVAAEAVSSSLMAQEYPATPAEAFSATDVEKFMTSMLWWDACRIDMPALDVNTPLVLSADAGIINDSFALTLVSRHWTNTEDVAVRYAREWRARPGQPVDTMEVEDEIRRLCARFDVVELAYDPSQMLNMAARLRRDGAVRTLAFQQGADRLEADKQLLDLVMQRRLVHDGDAALRDHIDNADRKVDVESRKLRIIKRQESKKIDLCVALSMGVYRCLKLPLG